jgi:hypothetical protein
MHTAVKRKVLNIRKQKPIPLLRIGSVVTHTLSNYPSLTPTLPQKGKKGKR